MRKIVLAAFALLTALASAAAQVPNFPQTLPANTVVGRLGVGAGPSQAIPITNFTSSIINNVQTNLRIFPITSYGADPTGVADSARAINQAISLASVSGGVVYVPPSDTCYKVSSALTAITANDVFIQGSGYKSCLSFNTTTSDRQMIRWLGTGSVGTYTLAADVSRGDQTVTLASVSGLSIGDLLVFYIGYVSNHAADYWAGTVQSVDSGTNTVRFNGSVPFSVYATDPPLASHFIQKVSLVRGGGIRNLRLTGSLATAKNTSAVFASRTQNQVFDNIQCDSFQGGTVSDQTNTSNCLTTFFGFQNSVTNINTYRGSAAGNNDVLMSQQAQGVADNITSTDSAYIGPGFYFSSDLRVGKVYASGALARNIKLSHVHRSTFDSLIASGSQDANIVVSGSSSLNTIGQAISQTTGGPSATPGNRLGIWIAETDDAPVTITGATQANPVVITATGHKLQTGFPIHITGVSGMTQLNGNSYLITRLTANTFSLQTISGTNVDGTGYSAYTSGGVANWFLVPTDNYFGSVISLNATDADVYVDVASNGNVIASARLTSAANFYNPNSTSAIGRWENGVLYYNKLAVQGSGGYGAFYSYAGSYPLKLVSADGLSSVDMVADNTGAWRVCLSVAVCDAFQINATKDLSGPRNGTFTGTVAATTLTTTNGVALTNLAQVAASRILGNATSGTANVLALTIPNCVSPGYLTWTDGAGFGCVTSPSSSSAAFVTGTAYAVGDLMYANTTSTLASLADVATGNALISGGVGVAPAWGKVSLPTLATQATNTLVGNATSGSASPTALTMTSCSTASSALTWTTNSGFGCNTSVTASGVAVGGITGLGTGVATALAVNVGSAGAPVVNGGALGTPSSGTLTNATGIQLSGHTSQAADTVVMNATGSSAAPTAVSVPSCSTAGRAIQYNTSTHTLSCSTAPARSTSSPADPTGTTSATAVMMGLAGTITPTVSGNVMITVSGIATNATGGGSCQLRMRYGTGAAPANGAAASGTTLGGAINHTSSTAGAYVPFSITGYVTGLSAGTAYWIDTTELQISGGICNQYSLTIVAVEL